MRQQIRSVPTGRNFRLDNGSLYVRIPDMILQFNRADFSVNCLRLLDNSRDPFASPEIVGDYIHPETVVDEIIERDTI